MVGICFGHQIIARALGARVDRSTDGWEVAVNAIDLTEAGKELFGRDSLVQITSYPLFTSSFRMILTAGLQSLHQMHRDIVYDLPSGCANLGRSPRCQIQGLYMPTKLLTVQGHPEFDAFAMGQIAATRYEQRIFDEGLYGEARCRTGLPHDGGLVGKAICRFLGIGCRSGE